MAEKTLTIDGYIDDFWNSSEEIEYKIQQLDLSDDDTLLVLVNSPGGDVYQGFSIYNKLKALPNKVTTRSVGLAASIASVILLAGDRVEMAELSGLMIHKCSANPGQATADELEAMIEHMNNVNNTAKNLYIQRTGESEEVVDGWLSGDKWFSPQEAKDVGMIDEIIPAADLKIAAFYNPNRDMDTLKLKAKVRKALGMQAAPVENQEGAEGDQVTKKESTAEAGEDEPTPEEALAEALDNICQGQEAMSAKIEALEQANEQREPVDLDAFGEQMIEKMTALMKGVRSNGAAPRSNSNMQVSGTYQPKNPGFEARRRKIIEKTKVS